MPNTAVRLIVQTALISVVALGPLAACSDDTDDASDTTSTTASDGATTTTAEGGLEAFCAVATDLVGITPTSEQLAEYAELAPEEIAEPVETFVAAFEAAEGDLCVVFADPEASAASDEIAAFESDECGITQPGPPPGDEEG